MVLAQGARGKGRLLEFPKRATRVSRTRKESQKEQDVMRQPTESDVIAVIKANPDLYDFDEANGTVRLKEDNSPA
jgi:hypothetical protein